MSFPQDLSETFSQISAAGSASLGDVSVAINNDGSIVGQGITPSQQALSVSGGHLDNILSAFGGIPGEIQGGASDKLTGKAKAIMKKSHEKAQKLDKHLEEKIEKIHYYILRITAVSELLESGINSGNYSEDSVNAMKLLQSWISEWLDGLNHMMEHEFGVSRNNIKAYSENSTRFVDAMKKLKSGGNLDAQRAAGIASLTFSSVNDLNKIGGSIQNAFQSFDSKQEHYINGAMPMVQELFNGGETQHIAQSFKSFAESQGYSGGFSDSVSGGVNLNTSLAERLIKSREAIKVQVNKFLNAFGADLNDIVEGATDVCNHLGKEIKYNDNVVQFLDTMVRLNEFLTGDRMRGKIYQHLLEINVDTIDSKEIKDRFLSTLRLVAENALAMGSNAATNKLANGCKNAVANIGKYSDMLKTFRDETQKNGGNLTEVMNDLFSTSAAKIEITALTNPLAKLQITIKKLQFFKNIAIFRSNLANTNKELMEYSKDYEKSVGQAIGQAIDRINTEYNEIIRQVDDNKVGMGLEIEMYNESTPANGKKISKEKLKMMYRWQCDARIGLYKTIEAIDLYLLHFTDAITKNPDAVNDLHKLLAATKIIAKWYDKEAGSNLIKVFESFGTNDVDAANFNNEYDANAYELADLSVKVGDERAHRIFERCRRAVQGVVVLKNIISYFISLGEKYGNNMRQEKSIYMAPSNIYKNLVNYLWVSALDINTSGAEILTENNDLKRLLTYEDTKVKIAQVSNIDPESMGINFNKHSIDKLRILKCHNELLRLQDTLTNTSTLDIRRVQQFVAGVFARLGKTKYIFEMTKFGVMDLSLLTKDQLGELFDYLVLVNANSDNRFRFYANGMVGDVVRDAAGGLPTYITIQPINKQSFQNIVFNLSVDQKSSAFFRLVDATGLEYNIQSLQTFMKFNDDTNLRNLAGNTVAAIPVGFLSGFLQGVTGNLNPAGANPTYLNNTMALAQRINSVLHYVIMNMLNKLSQEQSSSVFAIDDNYFILTLKAIAGKVLTVAGVNALFKRPDQYGTMISTNKTRIIMGGADSINADPDVIEDAVELYVRLPLLVEFYRAIFDNGNKEYKQQTLTENLDNEQISFVPEIGNIWSNLIMNIFDKARHIETGLYTQENMRKIVSEVNAIYKHYKGKFPEDSFVRDVTQELAREINRRYGVVKRQELLNYYKIMNETKRSGLMVDEINYTTNDFDILNQEIEFEEKSPSEAYLKVKETFKDPSASAEVKLNKLTDYKILKDFRERIEANLLGVNERLLRNENAPRSMIERIRMLKQMIRTAPTQEDKYGVIIKAIEDSESINQTTSDILMCFHEFVITPTRMLNHLHNVLKLFYTSLLGSINDTNLPVGNAILDSRIGESTLRDIVLKQRGLKAKLSQDNKFKYNTELANLNLFNVLSHFALNHGDLIKISITQAGRITLDLSEMQNLCEYLVSNAKFMLDKFTGIVPNELIESFSKPSNIGSVYWLEQHLVNNFFNRLNKSDRDRDANMQYAEDMYKVMPFISKQLFESNIEISNLVGQAFINVGTDLDQIEIIKYNQLMPVIKDSFMVYDTASKSFKKFPETEISVLNKLFDPSASGNLLTNTNKVQGIVQEFNTLIAHYLNDLYDPLSRKIYTKLFNKFANIAYQDAINGNAYPDFNTGIDSFMIPSSHFTLSATLAHVMQAMMNRIHPLTNVKFHEITNFTDVSEHTLERYRACLPMYLRLFETFLTRCKLLRRIVVKGQFVADSTNDTLLLSRIELNNAIVRASEVIADADAIGDAAQRIIGELQLANAQAMLEQLDTTIGVYTVLSSPGVFSTSVLNQEMGIPNIVYGSTLNALNRTNIAASRDGIILSLDDMINGITSLIEDAQTVYKELKVVDKEIPSFGDTRLGFHRSFTLMNNATPFAPLSTLTAIDAGMIPISTPGGTNSFKFLYAIQPLLTDGFQMNLNKIPYMKRILSDFNGYNTKANYIAEDKIASLLKNMGRVFNFFYDWKVFNGNVFCNSNIGANTNQTVLRPFQESIDVGDGTIINMLESTIPLDSKTRISKYVSDEVNRIRPLPAFGPMEAPPANPRATTILINIMDLGIMPINIHSLMREIPLANLYNYAISFDHCIQQLNIPDEIKFALKQPFSSAAAGYDINAIANLDNPSLRFLNDFIRAKITNKDGALIIAPGGVVAYDHISRIDERKNSKLVRNLTFLTLIQYAIKIKVKQELEFINTSVVSNASAVADVITNAAAVNDDLFQF